MLIERVFKTLLFMYLNEYYGGEFDSYYTLYCNTFVLSFSLIFRVAVKMTNRGNKHYMVRVILRVDSVDYTGKNGIPITKIENDKMVHCDLGKMILSQVQISVYKNFFYQCFPNNKS